jgi:hypothetical protein
MPEQTPLDFNEVLRKWAEMLKRTDTTCYDVPISIGPTRDGTWFAVKHSLSTTRCFHRPELAVEYIDKYLR